MIENFKIYPKRFEDKKPHYRYYKLLYTFALRLKFDASSYDYLDIDADLSPIEIETDRGRKAYTGSLTIAGNRFNNLIVILEDGRHKSQLVSFWGKNQRPDGRGSRGGAHAFAELAIDALSSGIVAPTAKDVVDLVADKYNESSKFNITSWILLWAKTLPAEPDIPSEPIAAPNIIQDENLFPPEIKLLNKWNTDVKRTGIPYINYEVDCCVKSVRWDESKSKIWAEIHFEDGQYVLASDFGLNDQYASVEQRKKVFNYIKSYEGSYSPLRLILTLKEGTENWTIAAATMLKRLVTYIN